jgi:hypothetical protein
VRELVRDQIEALLDQAGDVVDEQTARLRALGDLLERQKLGGAANLADTVATEVEGLSDRLAALDGDELLDAVRTLARRRGPLAFAAGGAAAGVLLWSGLRRAAIADDDAPAPAAELEAGEPDDAARER